MNMTTQSLVLGALVADAASLGLHWLYDPARLAQIAARGDIAFLAPQEENYRDCRGTFVHGARRCGDLSGYGAYCALMLRHLADHRGHFDLAAYQTEFLAFFGPGGAYVGYVDKPTRGTLLRLMHADKEHGFPVPSGIHDDQLPALATLPALVAAAVRAGQSAAALLDTVEQAVRVTNDNATAVEAARIGAILLHALAGGDSRGAALQKALTHATPPLADRLRAALDGDGLDAPAAAARFGAACQVAKGLPVVFHILAHARGYTQAVRANVLAGGDSCGRSMLIGAAFAVARDCVADDDAIPLAWLARLNDLRELADALARLCGHAIPASPAGDA